jgi:hypothetical protein
VVAAYNSVQRHVTAKLESVLGHVYDAGVAATGEDYDAFACDVLGG